MSVWHGLYHCFVCMYAYLFIHVLHSQPRYTRVSTVVCVMYFTACEYLVHYVTFMRLAGYINDWRIVWAAIRRSVIVMSLYICFRWVYDFVLIVYSKSHYTSQVSFIIFYSSRIVLTSCILNHGINVFVSLAWPFACPLNLAFSRLHEYWSLLNQSNCCCLASIISAFN